jgi:hypothetical protein
MTDMKLSHDQQQAEDDILRFIKSKNRAHILQGPAGTGKTYALNHIVPRIEATGRCEAVLLASSTNKAAEVMGNATGREVRTVHSMFGLKPANNKDGFEQVRPGHLLPNALLIIDECSMIGDKLLNFISPITKRLNIKVLFVGDRYQLPPVKDRCSIFSGVIPASNLTEVKRQSDGSPIIPESQKFVDYLDGKILKFPKIKHCVLDDSRDGIHVVADAKFNSVVKRLFNDNSVDSARVVVFTNEAAFRYNDMIRPMVYGADAIRQPFLVGEKMVANSAVVDGDEVLISNNETVEIFSATPVLGPEGIKGHDLRVMPENDVIGLGPYKVFVADDYKEAEALKGRKATEARKSDGLLKAEGINPLNPDDKHEYRGHPLMKARSQAWVDFFKLRDQLVDIRAPFAGTTHKAQGATFSRVMIDQVDMYRCRNPRQRAQLIYTALTRASNRVMVNGGIAA